MLNFALCDDSRSFLVNMENTINKLIVKHDFDAKVAFKSTNIIEVLEYMKENTVDVLFLDVFYESNINGIDIAKQIRSTNKDIYIIFITGHLEYTFLSFEAKPFDFIAKPIIPSRLEQTLIRLFDDITFSKNSFISINNKTFVNEKDINFIKRDGMKLVFKTKHNSFESYTSFNKFAGKLSSNFVRCHKSYIVNINNISHIETNSNMLFFPDNSICYIGPKYKDTFMEVINAN